MFQVFDLAMDEYDSAFPQRKISQRSAAALFHSNLGIAALRDGDLDLAQHHARLSASIDPKNSYLWINLGVISKRQGDLVEAEHFFKTALSLNDFNSLASSNLERLYRQQGKNRLAANYSKKAERARVNNSYVQFERAKAEFDNENYRKARGDINRAIRLHKMDPSFFELRSRVNQIYKRYKHAILDLEQAYLLAKTMEDRGRYFNKVQLVTKRAEAHAEKRRQRQQQTILVDPNSGGFPRNF